MKEHYEALVEKIKLLEKDKSGFYKQLKEKKHWGRPKYFYWHDYMSAKVSEELQQLLGEDLKLLTKGTSGERYFKLKAKSNISVKDQ